MFLVSGGSGNQTISHASYTKVEYNQEIIDTDSAFDLTNNKFVVPSGEVGFKISISCTILHGRFRFKYSKGSNNAYEKK